MAAVLAFPPANPGETAMKLTSSAFSDRDTIPRRYTCDGEDLSPPLAWSGVPPGAQSLLIACEDPDAPHGVFTHWVAFNLSPDLTSLQEGSGSSNGHLQQAVNDFRRIGYNGPCPPRGDRPHTYHFILLALDRQLPGISRSANGAQVLANARPHAVAKAELVGLYGRH